MKRTKKFNLKVTPVAAAVCAIASNYATINIAQAQDQAQGELLEEILVTARKREESASDVPVSISALSADSLKRAGVNNITDLFALIPGIQNTEDGSRIANKPNIRGVGSVENASIRAKVTTFIDGIPVVGAQGISSFAGLDHVEVLRGPQSAAFGRSTFGGAVNYVTKTPGNEFDASVRVGIGSDDTREISASLSTPLVEDKLAIAVTLEEKDYGGPSEWVTTSGDQLGARNDKLASVKLAFSPSDTLSGSLMYIKQEIDDGAHPVLFAPVSRNQPHPDDPDGMCAINGGGHSCVIFGPIETGSLVFDYDYNNPANVVADPGTRIERDRIQGSITKDFENGYSLTAQAARTEEEGDTWFDRDLFTGGMAIHVASTPESEETYAEVRLVSPGEEKLNWVVGASLYEYDYLNTVFTNKTAGLVMDLFSESATNVGVFFGVNYDVNDRLRLSVEGRYQEDEITGTYPASPARGVSSDISSDSTTTSFQPRLSLTYALNDESNLYFQVARGTNPAGFNANALDPVLLSTAAEEGYDLPAFQTFEEEEIVNIEFGFKGESTENNIRYAASVYYLEWSGYVQPVTGNWTPADGVLRPGTTGNDYFSRLFLNTGDLDGWGAELEGTWAPSRHITIGGAFAYSGLEFTDDACSPIPLDYGLPAIQTTPFRCGSVAGKRLPHNAEFTGSLNITYTTELNSGNQIFARADYQYRSKRFTEQINTDYLPAHDIVNLRAGLQAEKWSAELYVNNALDEDSPAGAVRFFDGRLPGMVFNTSYLLRKPRTVGINLEYNF